MNQSIDWTASMTQHFEYYEVDPNTFKDKTLLQTIKSSTINRDNSTDTVSTATIDVTELVGETYVRIYLIASQNGVSHKIPLGVFLVQTPNSTFDGKVRTVSMDAYSPLLELKEKPVPLGYSLLKGDNIMNEAYQIIRDNCRDNVVKTSSDKTLNDNFIANGSDNYLTFVRDLIRLAKYELNLGEMGEIIFEPIQSVNELQPVWTFDSGNSSILYPEISLQHDLYGIPNVVEVICSNGTDIHHSVVKNTDINSPTSIPNRGREIIYRDTSPSLSGIPTNEQIDEYAKQLLETLSSVEYSITYTHGYCPVRVGDCVRLNYPEAGLNDVKAKVVSQSIKCDAGCAVSETAIFTQKLWK